MSFLPLDPGYLIGLALQTVISGFILYFSSRVVGSQSGLLSAFGVAFLSTMVTGFLIDAYLIPMLQTESVTIGGALETNILAMAMSYVLPGAVWFVFVIALMKVGPVQALVMAFLQWLLKFALIYFGFLTFFAAFA